MDPKELRTASTYSYYWGDNHGQSLEWKIIPDAVWLQDPNDPLEFPESMELQENSIKEDKLDESANVFFKYIFPNVVGEFLTLVIHIILLQIIINIHFPLSFLALVGHGKIIDKYFSNP